MDFTRNNGFVVASSLSFYFMLSLVPFLLFLSSIFILVSSYTQSYNVIVQKIVLIFPPMLKNMVLNLTQPLIYKKVSYFSLILYAVTSLTYFYMIDGYINKIFIVNKKRPVYKLLLIYIMLVAVVMVLSIAYLAGVFVPIEIVRNYLMNVFKFGALYDFFGTYIMPFLSLFIVSLLLYLILPASKVRLNNAFKGAFFFALVIEVLKRLFIIYVVSIARLNIIYGTLWGYIAILIWVYALFCTFLTGAYIVYNLEKKRQNE